MNMIIYALNCHFLLYTLNKILSTLQNASSIEPTVIWPGNGYHVLVPVESLELILEDIAEFSKFEEPSKNVLIFRKIMIER
jgi:hypothetical protein